MNQNNKIKIKELLKQSLNEGEKHVLESWLKDIENKESRQKQGTGHYKNERSLNSKDMFSTKEWK